MTIRVLGCSGSIAAGSRTTAFLLDESILIDAGTGVGDLTLQELARIDHILISHSHLDHILSIGLLADAVLRLRQTEGRPPIQVHALEHTLQALRTHIFNNVIWPDFTRLPSARHPVLSFHPFNVGEVLQIGIRQIEVLSAMHTVPAVGFSVMSLKGQQPPGVWVFTGDTAANPDLWTRLRQLPVAQLVIETAFRDDERHLAELSRHLCPMSLGQELAQLHQATDVYITHIKPGEVDGVMKQIGRLSTPHRIHTLESGQCMQVGYVNG